MKYQMGKGLGRSPKGICRECFNLPNRVEDDPEKIKFYNTDVFALYQGMEIPVYGNLKDIPPNLPDQQKLLLTEEGYPPMDIKNFYQARLYVKWENPKTGELLSADELKARYGLIPPTWIPLIIFVIKAAIVIGGLILVFYAFRRAFITPCGETGSERQIDECHKIVIAPNCEWNIYNTCTDEWEGDWRGGFNVGEILKWVAIAAAVIGGAYIVYKIIPKKKEKEKEED